jgi:hypothetical protein
VTVPGREETASAKFLGLLVAVVTADQGVLLNESLLLLLLLLF